MAREWIDERNYRILHNRYNDKGEVVEQFYRYYKENETDTTIFLRPDVLMVNFAGKGTASGNLSGIGKAVVLECEELGFVGEACPAIKGYYLEYEGKAVTCKFDAIQGEDIVIKTEDGVTFELVK